MPFSIQRIDPTIEGTALDLATVMVSSRWPDIHWRNLWEAGTTEQAAITTNAARLPRNLISNRHAKRYQMAIDDATGEIVAYCRWVLPDALRKTGETVLWEEAQVKQVTVEQKRQFEQLYKTGVDEQGKLLYLRDEMIHGGGAQSTQVMPQPQAQGEKQEMLGQSSTHSRMNVSADHGNRN